jgi:hypothetical protein
MGAERHKDPMVTSDYLQGKMLRKLMRKSRRVDEAIFKNPPSIPCFAGL